MLAVSSTQYVLAVSPVSVYGPPAATPLATVENVWPEVPHAKGESSTVTVVPLSVDAVQVQAALVVDGVQLSAVGAKTGVVNWTVFDGGETEVPTVAVA
jgi:hypothetical protein